MAVAAEQKVWLNYTQKDLNDQYNQRFLVPNADEYIQRAMEESARVRAKLECRLDVRYGPSADERLDIFPAARKGAPIVVYIHGGAWTRNSKEHSSYFAETFVGAGLNFVATEFGLCPKVSLDELVRHNRGAIQWVHRNAREIGGDPDRLYVAGHSSGGHVTGMMIVTDWAKDWDLPADVIKGALAGSGMYDLEPVRLSSRNDYLKLDVAAARRNSPILHIRDGGCPLVMCYGEKEQKEFRRQSIEFAAAWRARGLACMEFDLPGLNHFDVGQQYNEPDAPFLKAFFELIGASAD
jgi:arylformamidase